LSSPASGFYLSPAAITEQGDKGKQLAVETGSKFSQKREPRCRSKQVNSQRLRKKLPAARKKTNQKRVGN
jgi:hypothetical protein